MRYYKKLLGPLALFVSTESRAVNSIGEISSTLFGGVSILSTLMILAAVACGAAFFISAIIQYKIHRTNPKLAPLSLPATYLVLSICCFLLPMTDRIKSLDDGKRATSRYQERSTKIDKRFIEQYIIDEDDEEE